MTASWIYMPIFVVGVLICRLYVYLLKVQIGRLCNSVALSEQLLSTPTLIISLTCHAFKISHQVTV